MDEDDRPHCTKETWVLDNKNSDRCPGPANPVEILKAYINEALQLFIMQS